MDRFVTVHTKKTDHILCNPGLFETLRGILATGDTVCLYGDSGVGKSHMVNVLLEGHSRFDLIDETVRDLERLENSTAHVVCEDLDLLDRDRIKAGRKYSKGALIIITRSIAKVDFCNCLHLGHPDIGLMVKIGLRNRPKESIARLTTLAREAGGNIRTFLYSIDFSDSRDMFRTPKDFVGDLLCPSKEDPRTHLGHIISEHGYVWGVVHDNYVDAPGVDTVRVSECMSLADLIDLHIYNGNWDALPFFCTVSTVVPALEINHGLVRSKLRPGSAWTKFGNLKMRANKLANIRGRTVHSLDLEGIRLVIQLARKEPQRARALFQSYGLVASDVDFMNHLALGAKLALKETHALKKLVGPDTFSREK